MDIVANLTKLLDGGKDSALLRFSLGTELLKRGDAQLAASHLREALRLKPDYSAAYKALGKALVELGESEAAMETYRQGIAVAGDAGDQQAAKEMGVFLRRLEKQA